MSCLKFKSFDSITRHKIAGKLWPVHRQTFKTLWPQTQFVSSSKHLKSKQKPHHLSLHLLLNSVRKIVKNENTMDQFTHVSWVRSLSHARLFATHGLQPRLLCPWNFPGKDTGVVYHFLLQGIFPTQGSNLGLLHWRQILHQLSYQGSPRLSQKLGY